MKTKNAPNGILLAGLFVIGLGGCGATKATGDSDGTAGDDRETNAAEGAGSKVSSQPGGGTSGSAGSSGRSGGRGGSSGTDSTAGSAGTGAGGAAGKGSPSAVGGGSGKGGGGTGGTKTGPSGKDAGASGTGGANGGKDGGVGAGGTLGTGGGSPEAGASKDAAVSTGGDAVYVPDSSWACGMADGIPSPKSGTLVFSASLDLGDVHDVGLTQYGKRRVLDIKGGKFTGDKASGEFQAGGFDFELTLSNGAVEVESINVLKASDGTPIFLRSCGVAPDESSEVRLVPDFEVATSKTALSFLNTGKFVATRVIDTAKKTMQFDVYDVSAAKGGDKVQITKPAGGTNQPWNCATQTGSKGDSVFTENVTLGSSISVGTSDKGSRNIIPITGGTTTGQVTGKIVNGGGDYQFTPSGGSTSLDAKYVLAPDNGEFIIVRNCGPMGKLIPQFETKADGKYAFLNANTFISSDPGTGSGGVSITFYQRK